jgi:phosphatidylserine synthase
MPAVLSQLVTAFRLVIGTQALILSIEGDNLVLAATLITASVILESVNERLAEWRSEASPFGERFAGLVDYTTFIITPWVLTRALLIGRRNMFQEVLLDLPLLAGAIRASRTTRSGLSPVFFAFVGVTGILLQIQELVSTARLTTVLPPIVAALSILMIAPVRYRPLPAALALVVLVLVAAMPFVQTEILAGGAILLGSIYIIVGPFAGGKATG